MNDSTFILGSLHYNAKIRPMLMGIKVKEGIEVLWYKALIPNPDILLDIRLSNKSWDWRGVMVVEL